MDYSDSLKDFFASVSPVNFTFDPKVIYDQYSDRFVVVTLEQTDNGSCSIIDTNCTSRLLVAVSDDGDPNGAWFQTAIDSEVSISGADRWLDYPGLAVDEEAIYVTGNMFQYSSAGGAYGGVRLWILNKGEGSGGLYDGGSAVYGLYDPYASAGIATTTQPAHVFGTSDPSFGTDLASYSGLTDGFSEYVQVVRVDNPLTSPTFTQQYINVGNIEPNTMLALPDASQLGTAATVEVNDRRALNAVWRENLLYMTATITPVTGPDAGQTTAYWWSLDTTVPATLAVADQGQIGGEDIASETATFFPSIAVDDVGDFVVGFSASAPTIYPGAYYTSRMSGDPAGTTSGSAVLRPGTDFYIRTFGAGSNRWGDYSGAALDPDTGCFWVYNQFAMTRGTPTGFGDDGRWRTAFGEVCLAAACPTDALVDNETFAPGSHVVLASNSITVTGNTTVQNGADLTLVAGDHIGIGPGFTVENGAVFAAQTGTNPCI